MKVYKSVSLAGAVAATMAVTSPPLDAQRSPGERIATVSQTGGGRRGNAFEAIGIHGFSIVLVVGDMQGAAGPSDTVPGAAKKALADMRDFLPYKNYRLLDAEWMLCCGGSFGAISGRVRGPEEQDYSYSLLTTAVSDRKITVHFSMRESAASPAPTAAGGASMSDAAQAEYSRQLYEASKERDEFERQVQELRRKSEVGIAPKEEYQSAQEKYARAAQRTQELRRMMGQLRSELTPNHPDQRRMAASMPLRSIMDSTFSIAVGETVVIGTSRLKGEKALIALLTAATKPSPAR